MARKDDIAEEEAIKQEVETPKGLFKKQEEETAQPQVTAVISDSQLLNLKLDNVLAKLDEVLALAKQ